MGAVCRKLPVAAAAILARMTPMKTVALPDGETVAALGLGTWRMGESARTRRAEVEAVRFALEIGYRLIDTAEMYGEGGAEEVIGEALAQGPVRREQVFIVSKVYPHNASRKDAFAACERSLKRLRTDRIDLYLLHWRGSVPLSETVDAFEQLRERDRIRHWGVSNFDVDDLGELWAVDDGERCAANQVYYSAGQRGIEFDLLPWQRQHGVPAMAYCPIDQGALARDSSLHAIARARGATPAQIALAWVLRQPDVIAIPKAVQPAHLRDNLAAASIELSAAELVQIDALFPPPKRKRRLAMS
jgi:diketogulonate reductase-like aldo/keto reductase